MDLSFGILLQAVWDGTAGGAAWVGTAGRCPLLSVVQVLEISTLAVYRLPHSGWYVIAENLGTPPEQ